MKVRMDKLIAHYGDEVACDKHFFRSQQVHVEDEVQWVFGLSRPELWLALKEFEVDKTLLF